MEIDELIKKVKDQAFPTSEYAVFGSAVLAVRKIRTAPNIDLIVTDHLWKELLKTDHPDSEGFIRRGPIKLSNWWFAPTKKSLVKLIKESELIKEIPFVQLEDVLDYKKGLSREKDKKDVELILEYLSGPSNLGIESYEKFLNVYVDTVNLELGDKILGMVLFGSVCRNQAKGDSDLDIFTFFDDEISTRKEVSDQLISIIVKLREHHEYLAMAELNIFPEVYPFLISRSKSKDLLPVFLDVSDHGLILKDSEGIAHNLITEIKEKNYKRTLLPNGKWVWTNL